MMEKIRFRLTLLSLKTIALLPLSVLYVISDIMYLLMLYIVKYRQKVVRKNLRMSFPDKSGQELCAIEKGFYHHLCDCMVESIKLLHISDRELNKRIEVRNAELIEELAADGKSIIVFLGHYGNWEWVQKVTWHYKRPQLNAEIYRPLKDKSFNTFFSIMRSRFDTEQIPQKKAVRTLLKYHNENRQFLVGFISDQRAIGRNVRHWTTFLNQDTSYTVGGEEIGRHIGAHFVYLDISKEKRGRYIMTFRNVEPLSGEKDYPYTLGFYRMFEQTICHKPELWLWSHKRWNKKRMTKS